MLHVFLFFGATALSVIGGMVVFEISRHTHACRQIGRQIASAEFLENNPNGFQDAISDPRHNLPFFIAVGAVLIGPIIGYQIMGWSCLWLLLSSYGSGAIDLKWVDISYTFAMIKGGIINMGECATK